MLAVGSNGRPRRPRRRIGGRCVLRIAIPAPRWSLVLCVCACVLAAGCGSRPSVPRVSQEAIEAEAHRQSAFRFEQLIEETGRLQEVAFPILTANDDYCGEAVGPAYGLSVLSLQSLHADLRAAAAQRLLPDTLVTVVHVAKDSPARRAGLAPGDRILAVAAHSVPDGPDGVKVVARTLSAAHPGHVVPITVMRGARQLTFSMRSVRGCLFPVLVAGHSGLVGFTDGARIIVGRGVLRLAASDDELALVVAHELGHIVARHLKPVRHRVPGESFGAFRLDVAIGAGEPEKSLLSRVRGEGTPDPYAQPQESEADYLGIYFAARAGFDTRGAEAFWRKITDKAGPILAFSAIHPASPERFVLIGKTQAEIALKQGSGLPLYPNLQGR